MKPHHAPITLEAASKKYPGLQRLERFQHYKEGSPLVEIQLCRGVTDLCWYRGEDAVYITSTKEKI